MTLTTPLLDNDTVSNFSIPRAFTDWIGSNTPSIDAHLQAEVERLHADVTKMIEGYDHLRWLKGERGTIICL
ncbi:unnamed protein product [Prunus brigantina]